MSYLIPPHDFFDYGPCCFVHSSMAFDSWVTGATITPITVANSVIPSFPTCCLHVNKRNLQAFSNTFLHSCLGVWDCDVFLEEST